MQSFLSMSVFIFDEFLIFDLENHIAVKVDQKVPQKKMFQNAQKREVPRKRIEFFFILRLFCVFSNFDNLWLASEICRSYPRRQARRPRTSSDFQKKTKEGQEI